MIGGSGKTPAGQAPQPSGRRSRWVRPVAVAFVVAVVGIAVLGGRWWMTSADAFDGAGGFTGSATHIPVGTTSNWTVAMGVPDVQVTGYELVFADGSGPSASSASVCWGGSGFGGLRDDLAGLCPLGLLPLDGADLTTVPSDAFLVVSVAPLSTEPVTVVGLRIRFEDGLRRGVQTLPLTLLFEPDGGGQVS